MEELKLKQRVSDFINELRLPVTRFAIGVGLSADSIHKWLRHDLKLSEKSMITINEYLKRFGR